MLIVEQFGMRAKSEQGKNVVFLVEPHQKEVSFFVCLSGLLQFGFLEAD